MKTSKSILRILGGVAVGTALGILIAPDKGANTRKKIVEKSQDAKNKAMEGLKNLADEAAEKYKSVKNKAEDLAEKGNEDMNAFTDQMHKEQM